MISAIAGAISEIGPNWLIIDTAGGLSYKVYAARPTAIGELGSTVRLLTYHHIREDSQELFGFLTAGDQAIFELLLTVSGVGPKVALNILANLDEATIIEAIGGNQPAILKTVPGIGQRLAEKIVVELKGKLGPRAIGEAIGEAGDLIEALSGLGYQQSEILAAIKTVDSSAGTEQKLKEALRLLSKR